MEGQGREEREGRGPTSKEEREEKGVKGSGRVKGEKRVSPTKPKK